MKTYPTSNAQAQMTHAAWDSERGYDIEDEARRNPFLAAHMARCDAEAERRRIEQEYEQEAEYGESKIRVHGRN